MQGLPAKTRKALALRVQQACRERNLAAKALAQDAKCNVRTVQNFFNSRAVKESTARQICKAVDIDFDRALQTISGTTHSADLAHGSYSEAFVGDYEGNFYAYRRAFADPSNFLRSLFSLRWDRSKYCLRFDEYQTYDSARHRRKVSFDQTGEVFISNTIGLVHLLTTERGAVRLITLTRLHHDQKFMQGLVLTQAEWPDHYQPAVSPVYFEKVAESAPLESLVKKVGPITVDATEEYQRIKNLLEQIEKDVAGFTR